MKIEWNKLIIIILISICLLLFSLVTIAAFKGEIFSNILFEREFYIMSGIAAFTCFCVYCIPFITIYKKGGKRILGCLPTKRKLWIAALITVLYTVGVYLINNLWRYIGFNSFFNWQDPVSYRSFLIKDILFAVDFGVLRYSLILVVMAILCFGVAILTTPKNRERILDLFCAISPYCYVLIYLNIKRKIKLYKKRRKINAGTVCKPEQK